MNIVSLQFALFFVVVLFLYYVVPKAMQWVILLIASFTFFMLAGTPYTFVYLVVSIVATFFATNYIDQVDENVKKRKMVFIGAIIINLGMLAILKYTNFFLDNTKRILHFFGLALPITDVHWIAALGISFYTLQMVGYLCDIYWGMSKPQKNIFKLSLFSCYFPQIVTGPISRYSQLEGQLYAKHKFDIQKVFLGLQRILWGVGKKLAIAERISPFTATIFAHPEQYGGIYIWLGTLAYVLQIYADFSGSMDILIGVSECFGIKLPENFNLPFFSRSIQEFWQKWHITLGTWLKDYLMYPILRSKLWTEWARGLKKSGYKKLQKTLPTYTAMMILWVAVGVWHGNGWKYIFEGLWFGIVIILGQVLEPQFTKAKNALRIKDTNFFIHLFQSTRTLLIYAVGALFFRANDVSAAFYMIKSAFVDFSSSISSIGISGVSVDSIKAISKGFLSPFRIIISNIICIITFTFIMCFANTLKYKGVSIRKWVSERHIVIRWFIYYAAIFLILITAKYGSGYKISDFIYGGF